MSLHRTAKGDHVVIDGGDRACGELLLHMVGLLRDLEPGQDVRLIATDPAAPVDIPAWCYLTGHHYVGSGSQPDGRAHYNLKVTGGAAPVRADQPWRLVTNRPAPSVPPT